VVPPVSEDTATIDELKSRMAGMQSAKDKEIAALREQVSAEATAHAAAIEDFKSQLAKSRTDFEGAQASLNAEIEAHSKTKETLGATAEQLQESQRQHAALVGGTLTPQNSDDTVKDFYSALKKCNNNVAEVKKNYPKIYADFKGKKGLK